MLSALRNLKKKLSIKLSQILCDAESFIVVRTARFRIDSTCHPQINTIKYQPQSYSSSHPLTQRILTPSNRLLTNQSKSRSLLSLPSRAITYNTTANDMQLAKKFHNYHTNNHTNDRRHITVGVTGASGFVGSHCVQQLLLKGYTVNGTVSGNPTDRKYEWIHRLPRRGKLNLFQANLLEPGSFDEAIADCDYLFHVASRVNTNVKDAQKEMVQPAVHGTFNVLNSCLNTCQSANNKLKRVIVTSSTYTLYGNPSHNYTYDESDWNEDDTVESHAYAYSKTKAERLGLDWMRQHRSQISFDLISVLPPLIVGAELNDDPSKGMSAGNIVIGMVSRGLFTPVNVTVPLVDVRDVAAAHIFFIENGNGTNQGSGRFVVAADCVSFPSLFDTINEYSRIELKKKDTVMIPKLYKRYVEQHENVNINISNDKIKSYGFHFRTINDTIQNTMEYLFSRYKQKVCV